jgi:SAM-dependent methyltransferase
MIYQEYAPFYDGSGQIRFAVLMAQYLSELLARHPVGRRRALDLACGTGTLALALADEGWQVVGLDASVAMLAQARAKAANVELAGRVAFVLGDIRDFGTKDRRPESGDRRPARGDFGPSSSVLDPSSFDLVTCVYDSLNYLLTEAELAACFRSAAAVLAPGGLLVIDMNTRWFLEHDWGTCEVIEHAGFVQVSQSHFDPVTACSTMVLSVFAGDDEQGYDRFDETHVERAYDANLVTELLVAAGLRVEGRYDCFTFQPIADRTQRIAWVARKPGARG